jgi:DivIVA domain-containing protein
VPVLLLLLVLAVLGAVAVVAAGWGDGLAPSTRRPGPRAELPPDPRADDLDRVRFAVGLRGYRMDEVDEVLDRLREELRIRDERVAALQARLRDEGLAETYDGRSLRGAPPDLDPARGNPPPSERSAQGWPAQDPPVQGPPAAERGV